MSVESEVLCADHDASCCTSGGDALALGPGIVSDLRAPASISHSRHVLHVNIANFYVAVTRVLSPKLRGYPVAVATAGAQRRILLDVSFEGREAGVYRGMLLDRALRRCPDLRVVNPRPEAYRRAGRALMEEGAKWSPRVEAAGPGHVFIDLTGTERLFGASIDICERLRKTLLHSLRLPGTVGLGSSKMISKVATRVVKPQGLCRVMEGCEEVFMAPLPVGFMPGIDRNVLLQLRNLNILYVRDLHKISAEVLSPALGGVAFDICRFARGIDTSPVRELRLPEPVVEHETSLREQTNDEAVIRRAMRELVIRGGMQLRHMGLAARSVALTLGYSDGVCSRRTLRMSTPLSGDIALFARFTELLRSALQRRVRVGTVRIVLRDLSYPYGQMDLFTDTEREENLMGALDTVRRRFGMRTVGYGSCVVDAQAIPPGGCTM